MTLSPDQALSRYLDLIDKISDTTTTNKTYPDMRYPVHLLPAPKETLRRHLEVHLADTNQDQAPLYWIRLQRGLWYLDRFGDSQPSDSKS